MRVAVVVVVVAVAAVLLVLHHLLLRRPLPRIAGSVELPAAVAVIVTLLALAVFGAFKGKLTGRPLVSEALRTVLVGALASGAAYVLARLISG